jgi:hypothetical protein
MQLFDVLVIGSKFDIFIVAAVLLLLLYGEGLNVIL